MSKQKGVDAPKQERHPSGVFFVLCDILRGLEARGGF